MCFFFTRIKNIILKFEQKIDRVLDDLRKFLGDDAIIEERCRKLIASGEYEFDDSILDCSPYCDGKH